MSNIERKNIEEELKTSYLTYAMSVNTNRAIPDARDGLKPSTRRIIYAMHQMGLTHNKNYDKCAAVVGEVMKNFHPHGDQAIYSTLVGLEQDFAIRHPLVDGQGNFGSIDDDPAGAMRYTECKLTSIANEMLTDIEKDTVDFQPNYKDSISEPTVLPALLPNLLCNGTTGIGVGYLTRIPPHNLAEVVNALLFRLHNPDCNIEDLLIHILGPDFPTGAIIIGDKGIKDIYTTGKGAVTIRAKTSIEENNRTAIIITEIPYQVKKAHLLEKIYSLVVDKTITGISDIRDESDKKIRVVIELKRNEVPQIILNQLYKHTDLQKNYNAIMLCLVDGFPKTLTLDQILDEYLVHRKEVARRRTAFELDKAQKREHVLAGYLIALQDINNIISIIRNADTIEEANKILQDKYELSTIQSKEILNLTLRQLTKLAGDAIASEHSVLLQTIEKLQNILNDNSLIINIVEKELESLKDRQGDERRTKIIGAVKDLKIEDLIADEPVVVVLSHKGYIKRMSVETYKQQHRGGTGTRSLSTKEGDFVEHVLTASNHQYMLFFTNTGRCFGLKVLSIPEGSKQSVGRAVVNLLPKLESNEKITAFIPVRNFDADESIFIVTKTGLIKKCEVSQFRNSSTRGINVVKLTGEDELVDAQLTSNTSSSNVVLVTKSGLYTSFKVEDIRSSGRNTQGRRGIRLSENDIIVQMIISESDEDTLLVITEKGYGKRTKLSNYSVRKKPGSKGVKAVSQTDLGSVVAAKIVVNTDELFILNSKGNLSRIAIKSIPVQGRVAKGVRIMKLGKSEKIIDASKSAE